MKRGDIVHVTNDPYRSTGSEQTFSRPAVIVSNDLCNQHSPVVEVVYTTTSKKTKLPTHVSLRSTPKESTALCEAVYSVDKHRIERRLGHVSDAELVQINRALGISLGLVERW